MERLVAFVLWLIGPRALIVLGDTLVADRWRWIRRRLPNRASDILDLGCGNGWLVLSAARLGHRTWGIGWADADLDKARSRIRKRNLDATFEVQDLRTLDTRADLAGRFDCIVCTEVIEHIIDDERLMKAIAGNLRVDGLLLLTAPNADYLPIDSGDAGPFRPVEDGGHVRKGYDEHGLRSLAKAAGLGVDEVSYCSGWTSQKATRLLRWLTLRVNYQLAWLLLLPARPLVLLSDNWYPSYPRYSICLVARRLQDVRLARDAG